VFHIWERLRCRFSLHTMPRQGPRVPNIGSVELHDSVAVAFGVLARNARRGFETRPQVPSTAQGDMV
jgi:hypothetical protein